MPDRFKFIFAGTALFFFFIFFSYLVHKNVLTQFDFNTTVRLQDNISRRFDPIFSVFSDVGKFEVMLVVLIVLIGFFVVKKNYLAAFFAFSLFGVLHLIELFGKFFVDHPPPPQFLLRTKEIISFPQFHVRSEFSYPSGHSGRAAFLSVILLFLIIHNKQFSLPVKVILCSLILGYDVVMFMSRIYLGEHWTSDVLGGAMLGVAFGLITVGFVREKPKHVS
jgi:undecaprenyl-diphosphatase